MVSPKIFTVGSTSTSDRHCSRFLGFGKVVKTAQPVSVCRLDQYDTGSSAVAH